MRPQTEELGSLGGILDRLGDVLGASWGILWRLLATQPGRDTGATRRHMLEAKMLIFLWFFKQKRVDSARQLGWRTPTGALKKPPEPPQDKPVWGKIHHLKSRFRESTSFRVCRVLLMQLQYGARPFVLLFTHGHSRTQIKQFSNKINFD